ncbi:hypothetical protein SESBI_14254 [Sesbania bispinosa]|nr:hypothetical protein SESBI_14254 [Sesbania bispinosa]
MLGVKGLRSESSSEEDDELSAQESDGETNHSGDDDEEGVYVDRTTPLCQKIHVPLKELQSACKPWKNSVIIKLLGKRVGLCFLQLGLEKIWNPLGDMEIIDLECDYFLVRFSNPSDYDMVFQGGPWMIIRHYLVVQRWKPCFFPLEDELKRVAVWVRIPGLPLAYWELSRENY